MVFTPVFQKFKNFRVFVTTLTAGSLHPDGIFPCFLEILNFALLWQY
jgi:hypothetical protein